MDDKLFILWTTDNKITAEEMVLKYAYNAAKNNWWNEITLIIWGASAMLVSDNISIQEKLKDMMKVGVNISACKGCTDDLGVSETIEGLGIEVKYWGKTLTELLKADQKIITI